LSGLHRGTLAAFQSSHIHKDIVTTEKETQTIFNWLNTLFLHRFQVFSEQRPLLYATQVALQEAADRIATEARAKLAVGVPIDAVLNSLEPPEAGTSSAGATEPNAAAAPLASARDGSPCEVPVPEHAQSP
jgi:hypothetical protein